MATPIDIRVQRRRTLQRLGRSALVWGIATFVVLQFGMAVAIETVMPDWRDPVFGIKIRLLSRRTVHAPAHVPTVVMVGSSRVENGLLAHNLETQLAATCGQPV